MFVAGVTGTGSVDAVGPAATSAQIVSNNSLHYAGAYQPSPSTVILRAFFDGLDSQPYAPYRVGYVQTISALCLGAKIAPKQLPGLSRLGIYTLPLEPDTALDFMGQTDAIARFGGALGDGDARADAPFYPFNAFLRLPNPQFQNVFWHPMPNGSMRPGVSEFVDPKSIPADGAKVSQVASLRSVVRPFLVAESQIAEICIDDAATVRTVVPVEKMSTSLYDLVREIYKDTLDQPLTIADALAAGSYLILLTAERDAFVARIDRVNGAFVLTIWEIDHDSFERIERDAAINALSAVQAAYGDRYQSTKVAFRDIPTGRGTGGVKPIPMIGRAKDVPTFSLIFTATAGRWQTRTTRHLPHTQFSPVSSIKTRIDWTYDPTDEDLIVVVHKPEATPVPANIGQHWSQYQALLGSKKPPQDLADTSPFTLAAAPWLDNAPKAPKTA
ncbi:hypothetical protein AS593_04230 [Caulobacter vibrioides]|nr:hypothetical protein AS593_04230 [Caulobacter vibrioides]